MHAFFAILILELLLLMIVILVQLFTQIVFYALITILAAIYAWLGSESAFPANVKLAHPCIALNVLNVSITAMVAPNAQLVMVSIQ